MGLGNRTVLGVFGAAWCRCVCGVGGGGEGGGDDGVGGGEWSHQAHVKVYSALPLLGTTSTKGPSIESVVLTAHVMPLYALSW